MFTAENLKKIAENKGNSRTINIAKIQTAICGGALAGMTAFTGWIEIDPVGVEALFGFVPEKMWDKVLVVTGLFAKGGFDAFLRADTKAPLK